MPRKPKHCSYTYLVIGIATLLPFLAFAQLFLTSRAATPNRVNTWAKVFGQEMDETIYDMAATQDDGVLLVGNTNLFKTRIGTGLIVKINSGGQLAQVTAPWSGGAYWDEIRGIEPIPDGGFFAVGIRNPQVFPAERQGWLLRLDPEGKVLWERMMKGQWQSEFHDVTVLSDGGVIVITGSTGGFRTASGLAAVRFDALGNIVWQRIFDDTSCPTAGCSIVGTVDDGALLIGLGEAAFNPEYGKTDVWVGRVNSAGELLWQYTYGGESRDEIYTGLAYKDGSFLLGGMMHADGQTSRLWLMRINGDGKLIWSNQYKWGPYGTVFALAAGEDERVIAGGLANMAAFTVFEVDGSGKLIWSRGYQRQQSDDQVHGLATSANEIVASGWTNRSGASTSWDIIVMKFDRRGQFKNSPHGLKVWAKPAMKTIKAPLKVVPTTSEEFETDWEAIPVTTPIYPLTLEEIRL